MAQNIITDECCGKREEMGLRCWGRGGLVGWVMSSKDFNKKTGVKRKSQKGKVEDLLIYSSMQKTAKHQNEA